MNVDRQLNIKISKVCEGFGYGDGSISAETIGEEAGEDALIAVDAVIHSPDILVRVSTDDHGIVIDDDGCGDGRQAHKIFEGLVERHTSLRRAKVFGGGATMTVADLIGSGAAKGTVLRDVFGRAIETLKRNMLNFGAHTDDHAEGKDCGCGAIDKSPVIIPAVAARRAEITETFSVLGVPTDGLDEVFDCYADYAKAMSADDFSGRSVVEEIISNGKIVKELAGAHKEARIVLNFVRGYTVNQQAVREASGDQVEVFGVDVWRMLELCEKLHPNDEAEQARAFQSMLVYTLGTACVLTKGDLPVYAVQAELDMAPQPIAA